jgi:hypothetical protein
MLKPFNCYFILAVKVMNQSKRRIVVVALLFTAVVAAGVSAWYLMLPRRTDSAGNFLFMELRTIVEAEVLQGKWGRMIDFPSYRYNVSTGRIDFSGKPFDLDKLVAVYGSLLAYRGAGRGVSSCLYPIYSTPFLDPCDSKSSIGSIDKDGTAHMVYENKQIVLSLNQQRRIESETIENSDGAVVKFKRTITIENLGFWKKANMMNHSSATVSLTYPVILQIEKRVTTNWSVCSPWPLLHPVSVVGNMRGTR